MKFVSTINLDATTIFFFTLLVCTFQLHAYIECDAVDIYNFNDEELQIIFDAEEIYPLVDYDTICIDYETQDYIDNAQIIETKLEPDILVLDDLVIPDVPHEPQLITMRSDLLNLFTEEGAIARSSNDIQSSVNTSHAVKNNKKHAKKRRPKLSKCCKKYTDK